MPRAWHATSTRSSPRSARTREIWHRPRQRHTLRRWLTRNVTHLMSGAEDWADGTSSCNSSHSTYIWGKFLNAPAINSERQPSGMELLASKLRHSFLLPNYALLLTITHTLIIIPFPSLSLLSFRGHSARRCTVQETSLFRQWQFSVQRHHPPHDYFLPAVILMLVIRKERKVFTTAYYWAWGNHCFGRCTDCSTKKFL